MENNEQNIENQENRNIDNNNHKNTDTRTKKKKVVKKKVSKNSENQIQNNDQELEQEINSDGINDVFYNSSQDNAKRIVNQIGEIQNDADEYINILINTMHNFENMKRNLNNKYNYFFRTLFSLLGYDYHTNIPKVNFFVYSTQAWIIEFARLVEIKYNEIKAADANKIITYANILSIMKNEKVKEINYLTNLGVLTSSLLNRNALTSLIIENNIGKCFLTQLELLLHEVKEYESSEVDKKTFDDIVSTLFKNSVERTLNIMENQFNQIQPNFIHYSAIYDELDREKEHPTFDDMFKKVKLSHPNDNSFNLYSVKICTETFYNYAHVKIDYIIEDINLFTKNYTSFMFKTKHLLGQGLNNIMQYNQCIFLAIRKMTNLVENSKNSINNLRKESLDKFYNLFNNVKGIGNEIIDKVNYKNWILSSYIISDEIKEYTKKIIIENPFNFYKLYLDSYISLIVDISLSKTERLRKYLSAEWELSIDEYQSFKENITKYLKSKYENVKNIKDLFQVTTEDYKVRLRLTEKLAFLNPDIYLDLYNKIEESLKNLKENVNQMVEKGKDFADEKINNVKDYAYNVKDIYLFKFKNFLQLK